LFEYSQQPYNNSGSAKCDPEFSLFWPYKIIDNPSSLTDTSPREKSLPILFDLNYFPKERASAFDRLRTEEVSLRLCDFRSVPERSLTACVAALSAARVRVALIDVTSADVATGPFSVMRAVSPDLQTIWYGYGLDRKPVKRISKIDPHVPSINPIWETGFSRFFAIIM
jgi:hypothetical protein